MQVSIMKFSRITVLIILIAIMNPLPAGLPSNEKLQNLKRKVDAELDKFFRIQSALGQCLEVPLGKELVVGTRVYAATCTTKANQKWRLDGAQLIMPGGLCLQPAAAGIGQTLELASCNGSPVQQWAYVNQQVITSSKQCVEIPVNEVGRPGAKVHTAICLSGPHPHQQWAPN